MSFEFPCSGCESTYEVSVEHIGRKFRCKHCGEICVVRQPERRRESTTARSEREATSDQQELRQKKANRSEGLSGGGKRAKAAGRSTSKPSSSRATSDFDADQFSVDEDWYEEPASMPKRRSNKKRASGFSLPFKFSLTGPAIRYGVPFVSGLIAFVVSYVNLPVAVGIGAVFFMVGAVMFVIAQFLGVCVAFQESFSCGVLYLICPFYTVYHDRSRPEEHQHHLKLRELGMIYVLAQLVAALGMMIKSGQFQ